MRTLTKKPYSLEVATFERTMFETKATYLPWRHYKTLRAVLDAYNHYKKNPLIWKFKSGTSKYWHKMENSFRVVHNNNQSSNHT